MQRFQLPKFGKQVCCVLLSVSLLWSCGLPVYAARSQDVLYASAQTRREAGPGEYFYTQLNDSEKAVYDAIVSQIEELAKDETDPSGVQVVIPKDSGYSPTARPIFAVFRDHPEFFWIDSSNLAWAEGSPAVNDAGDSVFVLDRWDRGQPFFYPGFTSENLQNYRDRLDAKVQEIQQGIPSTATDTVAKLKYLNDWIASNNVYNAQGLSASNFSRCAASGLLSDNDTSTSNDDPVCYGYATAMKVLLDALNIENVYIEGWAYNTNNRPNGEQHAWNYVKLDDGSGLQQWYALDPTWDDPGGASLPARQVYFLVGSNTQTEKNLPGYETFGINHNSSPEKSPAYKEGKFTYPALAAEARNPSADGNVILQKPTGDTTGFQTLQEAMDAAQSGDTLILQNAIQVDHTIVLKDGVTLDLNGQTGGTTPAVAITGTAAPVFRVEAGQSASVINSGKFTAVKLDSSSSTVVENNGSLTLGGNVQFTSVMSPMGGNSVISGNDPLKAPHVRYVALDKTVTAFLVAQPQAPAAGSYSAQDGQTVQDLLDAFPQPVVSMQYYGNSGSLVPLLSTESQLKWELKQSPDGGSATNPIDPLENGAYHFEAQAFDYTISYEVEVSGLTPRPQEITSVTLTGLDAPVAGQALDADAVSDTTGVTVSGVTWDPAHSTADYDTIYTATLTLTAESGYLFASSVTATVNGQSVQLSGQSADTRSVQVTFPATQAQDVLLESIVEPAPITADNGTALSALSLPTQVDLRTSDGQTRKADVIWNRTPVEGTNYQPDLTTQQTFRLSGTVTLPDGVNANGVALTVTIEVTVLEAPVTVQTAAPTAQPEPGHYTANQQVTLTSSTQDAVIYYTLDGTDPVSTSAAQYTGPISLNGAAGKPMTFQIRAVAISPTLGNSPVVTLDYTITLPGEPGGGSSGGDSGSGDSSGGDSGSGDSSSGDSGSGGSSSGDSGSGGSSGSDSGSGGSSGGNSGSGSSSSGDSGSGGSSGGNSGSGGSSNSGSSSTSGNQTVTEKHPDGSATTTVTKPDGTVITTNIDSVGNRTETVTNPDGSMQTTVENIDGSSAVTTVDKTGKTEVKVGLSESAVWNAVTQEKPVKVPTPSLSVTSSVADAPAVTITLPMDGSTTVEIPVKNGTSGTVAVLVKADGTQQILKTSLATTDRVTVSLQDGDTIHLVDNSKSFTDVPSGYWGAEAINFVASRELFSGISAVRFAPEGAMSRAMIVTVLARLNNVDTTAGQTWYDAGAQWAVEHGISDGANLMDDLTREQLATMLWRYAGSPDANGNLTGYPDGASVSSWASQAMAWAVNQGLISGMDGALFPQSVAT
ncbi:chitobiase/beta-hexosaminidase C-terminal domain-containing protein [Candidatus Avoscillospira sp. LCP25S3_F1]|uniref:chitobiase/beta-hexosaminidase C-terminal domain-containing protein n=1 Tax=Candidatus Avoscillospira sp. LCP25S3_F1 TaxID=3438825 RepID=UPI003F90D3DE